VVIVIQRHQAGLVYATGLALGIGAACGLAGCGAPCGRGADHRTGLP
jgi:hypothetical protein